MPTAIIQLSFTQIISASSQTDFEKNILRLSYQEYKMKSQAYDPDGAVTTFSALKAKDGRANSLHYKTGFAIGGLVEGLKNIIPNLSDTGGQPVRFEAFRFEVLESHISDQLLHKVAIHYITDWLMMLQTIGDTLLLSKNKELEDISRKPVETFMLKMQEGLSIIQYQEFPHLKLA